MGAATPPPPPQFACCGDNHPQICRSLQIKSIILLSGKLGYHSLHEYVYCAGLNKREWLFFALGYSVIANIQVMHT